MSNAPESAIKSAIRKVVEGEDLSREEMAGAVEEMMSGRATPAQIAALLTGLSAKGETTEELVGAVEVMRRWATTVAAEPEGLIDTCGTGGDYSGTFNISTVSALVAAGAGARVAKHGNRAASSRCGSADVLEALGVQLDLPPEGLTECLRETGLAFLFAPQLHPAMRHATAARREIGIRTLFNYLGPMTNPAGARRQLLGVSAPRLGSLLAKAAANLGVERCWVVHGEDGLDELTLTGPSQVWEVGPDGIRQWVVRPEDVGLSLCQVEELRGGSVEENAKIARRILCGEGGPARDVVLLNAGAALVVGGLVEGLADGVQAVAVSIDSGRARQTLEAVVEFTQTYGTGDR